MIFVQGLGGPETPRLYPPDKSWLCVEMAPPRAGVTRISRDGSQVSQVLPTRLPQGLAPDEFGAIWVLDNAPRAQLLRVTLEGTSEVVLQEVEGEPMLLVNDLCFGPDGALYVTDSGMSMSEWVVDGAVRSDHATAAFDGRVYRIDPVSRTGRVLDRGIRFTNGIAFGPDGCLYVNEMITGDILRYDFGGSAPTGRRERFANVMRDDWSGGFRGPDGMAFGADGRLYCTVFGQREIAVVGRSGLVEERLPTEGAKPTNVAWGPDGDRRLFVTEHEQGRIEIVETATTALPLYYGGPQRMTV
jgi:gluconolactonase